MTVSFMPSPASPIQNRWTQFKEAAREVVATIDYGRRDVVGQLYSAYAGFGESLIGAAVAIPAACKVPGATTTMIAAGLATAATILTIRHANKSSLPSSEHKKADALDPQDGCTSGYDLREEQLHAAHPVAYRIGQALPVAAGVVAGALAKLVL